MTNIQGQQQSPKPTGVLFKKIKEGINKLKVTKEELEAAGVSTERNPEQHFTTISTSSTERES